MRVATLVAATAAFLVLASPSFGHPRWKHEEQLVAPLVHEIRYYRSNTNRILRSIGERVWPTARAEVNHPEWRPWLKSLWKGRYAEAREKHREWQKNYGVPAWWLAEALLIHSCEGSWTDPNGPYYGGMQMDIQFQQAYGPEFYARWGTADNWPIWAQLQAAYRGYLARGGWSPWPACAARFGLL